MTNEVYPAKAQPIDPTMPAAGYRIRWGEEGDRYRLIQLRNAAGHLDLPGSDAHPTVAELQAAPVTLVFAERKGGARDLLYWLSTHLEKGRPWVECPGGMIGRDSLRSAPGAKSGGAKTMVEAVVEFGSSSDVNAAEAALIRLGGLASGVTLMLYDFEECPPQQALARAIAIRRVTEGGRNGKLRVVITSSADATFADTANTSGLSTVAAIYRTPHFRGPEIGEMATALGLTLASDAVEHVVDVTGGQMMLVQRLLQRIQAQNGPSAERAQVDAAARALSMSLPGVVQVWADQLLRTLETQPDLVPGMQAYARGVTLGPARFPPPERERTLLCSGWLKLDRFSRWGIASRIHADLALRVLDKLR